MQTRIQFPVLAFAKRMDLPQGLQHCYIKNQSQVSQKLRVKSCEVKTSVHAVLNVVCCSDEENALGTLELKLKHREKKT